MTIVGALAIRRGAALVSGLLLRPLHECLPLVGHLLVGFFSLFVVHILEPLQIFSELALDTVPHPEALLNQLELLLICVDLGGLRIYLLHIIHQLLLLALLVSLLDLVIQLTLYFRNAPVLYL